MDSFQLYEVTILSELVLKKIEN